MRAMKCDGEAEVDLERSTGFTASEGTSICSAGPFRRFIVFATEGTPSRSAKSIQFPGGAMAPLVGDRIYKFFPF